MSLQPCTLTPCIAPIDGPNLTPSSIIAQTSSSSKSFNSMQLPFRLSYSSLQFVFSSIIIYHSSICSLPLTITIDILSSLLLFSFSPSRTQKNIINHYSCSASHTHMMHIHRVIQCESKSLDLVERIQGNKNKLYVDVATLWSCILVCSAARYCERSCSGVLVCVFRLACFMILALCSSSRDVPWRYLTLIAASSVRSDIFVMFLGTFTGHGVYS